MRRSSTGNNNGGSYNGGCSSEIGVSSKIYQDGGQVDLGLKLQNQHRPFLFYQSNHRVAGDDDDGGGGGRRGGGTTSGYSTMSDSIYDVAPSVSAVTTAVVADSPSSVHSGAGFVRGLQPFDVSSYSSAAHNPFFKPSGGMATAALGFPFTAAQWKELERQAMIYKYMVASLPVPPDLLYSSFPSSFSSPATFGPASYLLGKYGSGLNLRWVGNSKDAEPGRCKRTDGKKWRCSRDVAPNQKYCERHMHRGRPRSRKPVELLHQQQHNLSDFTINNGNNNNSNNSTIKNNPTKKTRLNDPNPQSVGSGFASVPASKASAFGHPVISGANSFEEPRSLAWSEEQQWQQLVQANMNSQVFHHQFEEEPLNLNSHAGFNTKSDMGLSERPLIDAWSMGVTGTKDNHGSNKSSFTSSNGGHGNGVDEDMCQIHMGLGVIDSSWVGSPTSPGGPLGEVLRPGSVAATATRSASNPATSDAGEVDFVTPPATAVSSPSGVLQKTFASFSDSSGSSSPTCHNTRSDMPFHWLN